MRFAIKTRPEHQTWEQMREVWLAADKIELFESAWNWDHFYPLTGDLTGPNFEGWTMLAAMAQATSRIRIGCQVSGMIYRHPAVLANMAATVDIISAGRLELGLGAGWNQMECDAYGIDLPHCADIGRDLAEITCSVNVRLDSADDIDSAVATTAAYRDAGADMAVIGLPLGAPPSLLDPLADRLASLG